MTTVERDAADRNTAEAVAQGPTLDGRYRLERRLGSGGMGSVWQGRDLLLGRKVAIKLVAGPVIVGSGAAGSGIGGDERLRREAKALGALAHSGIARLYDYCERSEHTYLVMELAEGENLAAHLTRGRIPPERAVAIAAQCAEALDAAHRAWVVHRDVKPGNIVLAAQGVKLVDFGIASTAGDGALTAAGRVLGTAAYLAPERATGRPATPAADLYALGVVLYEMLAGRLPFRAPDPIAMMYAHTAAEPLPLPDDVPPALAEICRRLLTKDPAARPRSGAALARMLREASLEVPVRPLPAAAHRMIAAAPAAAPRAAPAGTGLRPRRVAALALGAAVVLVACMLTGLLVHGSGAAPHPGQDRHSAPATRPAQGK